MVSTTRLTFKGEPLQDATSDRSIVGKLIFLTTTRPDIEFAVQQVSQYMDKPTKTHLKIVHRILRYLKGNLGQGHLMHRDSSHQLRAFSDSDWATCRETGKLVTGFCVFLGDSLISWKSKKQLTVSRSSSEAKYRALASTACELQWLIYLLRDIGIDHHQSAILYCDNKSAIHIAENPVFHEQTKHIELDCYFVREGVQSKVIHLLHVPSSAQLVDVFTKCLPISSFQNLIGKLGVHNIYTPVCRGLLKREGKESRKKKGKLQGICII